MLEEKFVNPFTDYGFKKLFGEELNKDLLLDFLNELLQKEQGLIKTLTFLPASKLGATDTERRAIFDLFCENERGEKFIVEIQTTHGEEWKWRLNSIPGAKGTGKTTFIPFAANQTFIYLREKSNYGRSKGKNNYSQLFRCTINKKRTFE